MAFGKFGKYYPGDIEVRPESFDLIGSLRSAIQRARECEGAGHNLRFSSDREHCLVHTDACHVSYVFVNLLLNAIKYSPPGSVVDIAVQVTGPSVCFSVRDEGIGIPASERDRLFSPFFRASNVGGVAGTGMGLAIVKKSARLIGASVSVECPAEGGSLFRVSMPMNCSYGGARKSE